VVTTVSSYTDSRNRALAGDGFDGVVRVVVGNMYGTGVLLFDGAAVLTAAHLFNQSTKFNSANVIFETLSGSQTIASSQVLTHPNYDTANSNNDLALVWLSQDAPITAERYGIYRANNEIGKTITLVGYGIPGSGASGTLTPFNERPVRLKANNQFDADVALLDKYLGEQSIWEAVNGKQLIADFDNGLAQNDALGLLIQKVGLGLGSAEGLISKGDSGGPAFIGNLVAGIASYTSRPSGLDAVPDINGLSDSSFGEIAAWQRVSAYQQWIDQSLRTMYPNPPASQAAVQKTVTETNVGTTPVYFWVQFTGFRTDPKQIVSDDYATRSGTALAGQDFIATQGSLKIYPNEDHALILVEVIGDIIPEPDETFYLDVFNPVGGSFGPGVVQLTAVRTILNDDGIFGI
jgi:hypothetical protein